MQYSYDDVAEYDNAKTLARFSCRKNCCPVSHVNLNSDNHCANGADCRRAIPFRPLFGPGCALRQKEPVTHRRARHLTATALDWEMQRCRRRSVDGKQKLGPEHSRAPLILRCILKSLKDSHGAWSSLQFQHNPHEFQVTEYKSRTIG